MALTDGDKMAAATLVAALLQKQPLAPNDVSTVTERYFNALDRIEGDAKRRETEATQAKRKAQKPLKSFGPADPFNEN